MNRYLILFGVLVAVLSIVAVSDEMAGDVQLETLRKQNLELQKTIETQKQEIQRLENLCSENGIAARNEENAYKPASSALTKPFFGIYLGETLDSLKKRYAVSKSAHAFEDKDNPGQIWNVQIANENVKETLVYILNDQIYEIDLKFVDASRTNYDTINAQLEDKYKTEDEGGLTGAMFGEGQFNTVIDGTQVRISLNHDVGIMDGDTLELHYIHVPLQTNLYEEIKRRKAGKISSDL